MFHTALAAVLALTLMPALATCRAQVAEERLPAYAQERPSLLDVSEVGAICDTISNTHRCARAIERRQLAAGPQQVRRSGDTLALAVSAGDTLRLVDGDCCEGNPLSYSFIGYIEPIRHYVVHGQYFEGDTYLLIDRSTGRRITAWALPLPSPDARRLVSASLDIEAGYNPNGFQIWRVADDGTLELEWTLEPGAWGPAAPEWLGLLPASGPATPHDRGLEGRGAVGGARRAALRTGCCPPAASCL